MDVARPVESGRIFDSAFDGSGELSSECSVATARAPTFHVTGELTRLGRRRLNAPGRPRPGARKLPPVRTGPVAARN